MRSKAHFKTHPIHPMLVAFPIAFMAGAPAFDLAGKLGEWPRAWAAGAMMSVAAVVTGLIAAAPGLIDYLYVVPPKSSAARRATYHMVVNASALGLFGVSWFFRDWDSLRPEALAVALEGAGLALVTFGGWLGGTLVYRNQIGVDHRYAQAGKWREVSVEGRPGEAVAIKGAADLKAGHMMLIRTPDRRIVLARTNDGFVALDDHCTHRGGSLAGGTLACDLICCPWHGSQFNVDDGSVVAGPADRPIGRYQIQQSGDEIGLVLPF